MRVSAKDAGNFEQGAVAWDVLHAAGDARRGKLPDGLDLTHVVHLRPYAVACLAAMGALGSQMEQPLRAAPPRDAQCHEHLSRMGLFEWLQCADAGVTVRETNVPIGRLTNGPGDFSSKAMDVWAAQMGGLAAGLKPTLEDHLDEVILNAVSHADSPVGCLVAGQAFRETEIVEVAVVDLGQTIRGHLGQHPSYRGLATDEAAIIKATEEGVTGTIRVNRLGEPNSGAGLTELRRYCELGHGQMTVLSGESFVVFGPTDKPKCTAFRGGFGGCLVNLRFFTGAPLPEPMEEGIIL